jgi:hypothetical protein
MPYVYMCIHKETGKFYIGYREKNVKLNLTSDQDLPLYKTSSKIVKPNFNDYDCYIIAEFGSGDDAYDFEQQLIFENWGSPLLLNESCYYNKARFNHTKVHTDEARQKISNKHRGQKRKPFTEETKSKMSIARKNKLLDHTGKNNPMYGKLHSNETKKLQSEVKLGKKNGPYKMTICPHCELVGSGGTMKRWHFNNCKYYKNKI